MMVQAHRLDAVVLLGFNTIRNAVVSVAVIRAMPGKKDLEINPANALIKKAHIKQDAKTFLDWAISDSAMKMYAKVYPIVATDIEVETPKGWPADPSSVLIDNDLLWAAKNRQKILDEWTRRYDGKSAPRK